MFQTELVLKETSRPDFWAVASPLIWFDGVNLVTVPVGALTDLASVPRILWNIPNLDPDGVSRAPAGLHDWLYRTHQLTKSAADEVLRQAIIARGGSAYTARVFWLGVKIGGSGPYGDHPDGVIASDFDTQAEYDAWRASDAGVRGI